ncbi:Uncharacterized protein PECH_008975 [Penicillium ucsense]|uniref:Uncharacterized protein n=2 Tax=Penicillium TaxID=5073 RepID=A0A8J8W5Y1_9EURO|nr:uncharacterized protein N7539_004663 [Penicillium diatomitis]KAF7718574.1 Uncharacterized protein PECM_001433 [Penicillium ucsense]KAF7733760.1 Uncharacterized protein PECH_008975 [Penicillium ucsense]KAJ5489773.1 hypothetical protein N7539_004663 [Penicillium diatomitis]
MGLLSRVLKVSAAGTVASVGIFFGATRNDKFEPMDMTDPIFSSPLFKKLNPDNNPPFHDLCVRRVPLEKINPSLLEKKGKLVEAFCAGIWGGMGYIPQRAILANKYKGPETADQLWERRELLSNRYDVGTRITDHFEVVEKTDEKILVRCGASPREQGVRPSDGLFEIGAVINEEKEEAEFTLKSCFFQGLGKAEGEPFGPVMVWLHQQYTKLWMETAILKNCVQ